MIPLVMQRMVFAVALWISTVTLIVAMSVCFSKANIDFSTQRKKFMLNYF